MAGCAPRSPCSLGRGPNLSGQTEHLPEVVGPSFGATACLSGAVRPVPPSTAGPRGARAASQASAAGSTRARDPRRGVVVLAALTLVVASAGCCSRKPFSGPTRCSRGAAGVGPGRRLLGGGDPVRRFGDRHPSALAEAESRLTRLLAVVPADAPRRGHRGRGPSGRQMLWPSRCAEVRRRRTGGDRRAQWSGNPLGMTPDRLSSARVLGCWGSVKMASGGPCSTMTP